MKLTLQNLIVLIFLAIAGAVSAQAPEGINYQAIARDNTGAILVTHTVAIRITITNGSGGGQLYQETDHPTTNAFGLFTLNVGNGTNQVGSFASITWSTVNAYMLVEMDPNNGISFSTMGNTQLLSTPYSLFAKSAATATTATTATTSADNSWTKSGNNIYSNNTGNVGIGTTNPTFAKLQITPTGAQSGIDVESTNKTTGNASIHAEAYSISAAALEGISDTSGFGVYGSAVGGYGLFGQSTSGFGAVGSVSTGIGVVGSSVSNAGVFGQSDVVGVNSYAEGAGVQITYWNGGTYKETTGLLGRSRSKSMNQSYTYGVVGEALNDSSRFNVGVWGDARRNRTGGGISYGVVGASDDDSLATGVKGQAEGALASTGVVGIANSGSLQQIGVYGFCAGTAGSDYAGYFDGPIYATDASSGIKAFKIDHPSDPANKFLYHSSVESNDMMDIYNGNATTDANGEAVITLPSYFEVLNKDFKYQLTCMGQFAQAIVKNEVANNQFTIKTDKPNVKVSWQVAGVRHDAVAEKYRIVDEVAKTGYEKGRYLNPEVYGLDKSNSIRVPEINQAGRRNAVDQHLLNIPTRANAVAIPMGK